MVKSDLSGNPPRMNLQKLTTWKTLAAEILSRLPQGDKFVKDKLALIIGQKNIYATCHRGCIFLNFLGTKYYTTCHMGACGSRLCATFLRSLARSPTRSSHWYSHCDFHQIMAWSSPIGQVEVEGAGVLCWPQASGVPKQNPPWCQILVHNEKLF